MLPQELRSGSGMTCWRRFRDWQDAGIWELLHFALLGWLARHDQIDWSRAVVGNCYVRATCGGPETGPNPIEELVVPGHLTKFAVSNSRDAPHLVPSAPVESAAP